MTNPHNDTTTPANAHHGADKGQIEPLIGEAYKLADTTPPGNPITGKVIADKMREGITALHDNLTSLAHHATDLANNFPTMTNADFDVAISGLIGELWDSVEQAKELLPMPAQIYGQTLDVDFVNITNRAMQRFLEERQITGNATGDSEPCNQ